MKHFVLILFIFIVIGCQIHWYRARKLLSTKQKQMDNILVSHGDLLTLIILLFGYFFLVIHPYFISLIIYFVVVFVIGIVLLINYYKKMQSQNFPKRFIKLALLFFAIQYFTTVTIGFILIVIYNLA